MEIKSYNNDVRIHSNSSVSLTKKELLKTTDDNFYDSEPFGKVTALVAVNAYSKNSFNDEVITQSMIFAKSLKFKIENVKGE